MKISLRLKKIIVTFSIVISMTASAQTGKYKVAIDAGHGAHDFGATYHGFVEKTINLAVALKLGKILEADPSIQVIYTRNNDTFVDLGERCNIANKADANLFVSLHCNANKNTAPFGSETFVMGLSKSKSSLEVAKLENSVITLEADYKTKYKGYDPNSPESLISATIIQEDYLDQSIELASKIQDGLENKLNRKSRGVAQAPFMVLHKAFMPRVLVEMGFISNKDEGAYLNSEDGQQNMAKTIADAIFRMKVEHFGGTMPIIDIRKSEKVVRDTTPKVKEIPKEMVKETIKNTTNELPKAPEKINFKTVDATKVIYKIQLTASNAKIETKADNFKGLDSVSFVAEKGFYKYMFGETNDYIEAKLNLEKAKIKGYESAFIVAFRNGQKISLNEAVKIK